MVNSDAPWPEATAESRPWTRWWWFGSAVDRNTITTLLQAYHQAGLGGVEITSIYGVKGQEQRHIEYLSSTWIAMLEHAITAAKRLGMKVDLPPGSGWRLGGSYVEDRFAAARLHLKQKHTGTDYRAEITPSGEQVKRAGPGGRGKAINPFNRASIQAVIEHFTPVLERLAVRAQFHDSWEYDSNACPALFQHFRERRGYDLGTHLRELAEPRSGDRHARVKYDLQLTLAELALDEFLVPWVEWCHALGQLSRNQAHGSPGNLLDLYGAADVPETEVYRDLTPDTPLISKFASSAAHVTGKPLVSSETGTWIDEHFHVTLATLKRLVDTLFVSGINHHVYHGTAYSPADAPWPGWLFYASTQLNPQNPIWRDFRTLNAYVTRCQAILQHGAPDNDVLVYFPIHDILHSAEREVGEKLTIRGDWLQNLVAMDTLRRLWRRGYGFDYISDRQIAALRYDAASGGLAAPGATYPALVVPPCRFLPVETLDALVRLARAGARVILVAPGPEDVPGYAELELRRTRFHRLLRELTASGDLEQKLADSGVRREPLADCPGLLHIRRRHDAGRDYFVINQTDTAVDHWAPLSVPFDSVLMMDPMSGRTGLAQTRGDEFGEVRIALEPGAACVLRATLGQADHAVRWRYRDPGGETCALHGMWHVEFIEGGPELPPPYRTEVLSSWTDRNAAAERFAGTARYSINFDAPAPASRWLLDLGQVVASARVRLNGTDFGTLIGPSFTVELGRLEAFGNLLEVEVTNLGANRIRDLDRRGVEWRIFEDINFINRSARPFDASTWPVMPSGLLGPVRLLPLIVEHDPMKSAPGTEGVAGAGGTQRS